MQNAVDNPIAAAVAAAANGAPVQGGAENLLDIDFDGAAPASSDAPPSSGASGLEGLAGTPQRVQSPASASTAASGMDDMMGLFGSNSMQPQMGGNDLINGFAGLDLSGASQPPPPQTQLQDTKKTNEDLLGLY
jgi:AP-1 complex subunit beta-1